MLRIGIDRNNITAWLIAFFSVLLLTACTREGVRTEIAPDLADPIRFDMYLQTSKQAAMTRETYPIGKQGEITNDNLKDMDFGVFAQYTESNTFKFDGTGTGKQPYNFMWNQQIEWNDESGLNVTRWRYQPIKYWPNDNQPADDQEDDTHSDPAQGSVAHSYLTFFAYAPFMAQTSPEKGFDKTDDDDADGIVAITDNGTDAGDSHLTYRTSKNNPFSPAESVDLLWAAQPNRYKTDGGGNTTGTVNFLFKHALSKLIITVQGLFDHRDNSDTSPEYPDDRDADTHILIESVDFQSSPLFTEGKMYLAPRPDDAEVPTWDVTNETGLIPKARANFEITGLDINPEVSDWYKEDDNAKQYWKDGSMAESLLNLTDQDGDGDIDADDARALFDQLPTGVSHTEVPLHGDEEDYYLIIPNKEYINSHQNDLMTVRMVYYVITYDPRLTMPKDGYPKYFSIVKNDITARFSTAFAFEPNKKYKLRLQPGLTTVKFDVVSVDGWDTPNHAQPGGARLGYQNTGV